MNGKQYIQVLQQQKADVENLKSALWCNRREESLLQLGSPLAQIVIGVRRSGKSTLCHKFLKQNNVSYAYINFDDERLGLMEADRLENLLEAAYYVYENFDYLFLDEPQNVTGWHLFVNRLLRQGIFIFLTGSNAKLLSGELATHLTGRYNQVELYPLSFPEFLQLKGIKNHTLITKERAFRQKAFDEYLEKGGLPEVLNLPSWKNYVSVLFNSIINRDIIGRFRVRNKQALKDVALYAVSNFGREFSFKKIEKYFSNTSDITIKNYIAWLEQAYLLIGLNKFSFKSRVRLRNRKYYMVDTSFPTALNTITGDDLGWKLENIVFLELLRRRYENQYEIHYFKTSYEIDFVVSSGLKVVELIQVCADVSAKITFNREVNGLINGSKELKCNKLTLITPGESQTIEINGYKIESVSLFEWL
jgi:predicted AAA+ superfamily ATPase